MRYIFCLLLACTVMAQSPFRFEQITPESLQLSENGEAVYAYNHGVMRPKGVPEDRYRCCYVHPVHAPGGVVLTDDFPKDHYHHRGIFWVWPVVNFEGRSYDLWLMKGIHKRFHKFLSRETTANSATLAFENGWYIEDRNVVTERVSITAHPSDHGQRVLDFALTFEATSGPVELLGDPTVSKGSPKGYGGFCVRFAPRKQTSIITDKGKEARDTNMVPHPWAREDGDFAGGRAGLRIDDDPSNPGYPNGWCLRHYGFLGVNYPGNEPVTLEPGKPLKLKYKVTLIGDQ